MSLQRPETPEQAATRVEHAPRSPRRSCLCSYQVQHHAGIERAAARAHQQAVERGEAHGRVDAAAVPHGAHAGAIAEMGDDDPAARQPDRSRAGGGRHNRRTGRESRSAGCLRHEAARQGERVATSGWARWKAVSKQATCGSPARSARRRGSRRDCAAGAAAPAGRAHRARASTSSSITHGAAKSVPPWTTRWPTPRSGACRRDGRAASPESPSKCLVVSAAHPASGVRSAPAGRRPGASRCGGVPMPSICPATRSGRPPSSE